VVYGENMDSFKYSMTKTRKVLRREMKEPSSEVCRIPIELDKYFKKIGKGNIKNGLFLVAEQYYINSNNGHNESVEEQILMGACFDLMTLVRKLYGANHYNHFSRFPEFFREFLKKGAMDHSLLKLNPKNKTLDEVKGDDKKRQKIS